LRIADFRLRIDQISADRRPPTVPLPARADAAFLQNAGIGTLPTQSVALGWYALPSLGQRRTDDRRQLDCGSRISDCGFLISAFRISPRALLWAGMRCPLWGKDRPTTADNWIADCGFQIADFSFQLSAFQFLSVSAFT